MRACHSTLLAVSVSTLALSLAAGAHAAADAPATQVQELVVTAEKRSEALQDVPMSVTALPGQTLDKLQETKFEDFAASVPGLSLQDVQPGITRVSLRGENSGGDGSTVAVYLDESPIGSSNALLNGGVLTGDLDTWDLQRIEVLRGPQGTLYGANSEGGLIKFVTTPPALGVFAGAIEGSAQAVDHGQDGWSARGLVNVPIGSEVALRVDGFYEDVPGYIDDPLLGEKDINHGYKEGYRASLLIAPTSDLTLRLTAFGQKNKFDGTPSEDVDQVTLQPVNGDLTQQRFINERFGTTYANYNATLNWDFHWANLVSSTTYGILDSSQFLDATSTLLQPPDPASGIGGLVSGAFGENLGVSEVNDADLKKWTQEIRLASPSTNRLEWLVGGYYTHESGALAQALDAFTIPGGGSGGLPVLETVQAPSLYTEWAGFADLTFHLNSHFDIEAGGRYSWNSQTAAETVAGALVGPPTTLNTSSSGSVFTYSVSPRWKIDDNSMVYFRVATGYRPGGPNILPPSAPAGAERQYQADNTFDVEGGVRTRQADGRIVLDVSAFYIDWTKIQLLENSGGFGFNGNGGKARSDGFEGSLAVVPIKGLTLNLDGAYTDAVLTTNAPGVGGLSGDRLPYAPRWSGSLDGEYDFPLVGDYSGFVGATWSYVGDRSSDFSLAYVQTLLPSYDTFALRAGVQNAHWLVEVYAKNLGDSRGITAFGDQGAPGPNAMASVIQPATLRHAPVGQILTRLPPCRDWGNRGAT